MQLISEQMDKRVNTKSPARKLSSYFSWTETDEYSQMFDHTPKKSCDTTQGARGVCSKSTSLQYKYYIEKVIKGHVYTFAVYDDEEETIRAILFSDKGMCFPLFVVEMDKQMVTDGVIDDSMVVSKFRPHYIIEIEYPLFEGLKTKTYDKNGFR